MAQYPPIPNTLLHLGTLLGLPAMRPVCQTIDGTDIIFKGVAGCVRDETISTVLVSGRMLQFLQGRVSLHFDGTFKKRPRALASQQIYTVSTRYGNTVIGILRALMRKSEAAYRALIEYIKVLAPNLRPSRIHCDFEKAPTKVFKELFPNLCEVIGCLWHYAYACGKYFKRIGLSAEAERNDIVYGFIRCLCAVPMLPPHQIIGAVEQIKLEIALTAWKDTFEPFFQYWNQEWRPRESILSVFQQPERTNNVAESESRMLANVFPSNRPNVWRFLAGNVTLEHLAWSDKIAVDSGRSVNGPRRPSTVATDAVIKRYTTMLVHGDYTPVEFLHKVSWNIKAAVEDGLGLTGYESDSESE